MTFKLKEFEEPNRMTLKMLCANLKEALNAVGPTALITNPGNLIDNTAPRLLNDQFMRLMERREVEYRYAIFQADHDNPEWTKLCVRQADIILIVVLIDFDDSGDVPPTAVEKYIEKCKR